MKTPARLQSNAASKIRTRPRSRSRRTAISSGAGQGTLARPRCCHQVTRVLYRPRQETVATINGENNA